MTGHIDENRRIGWDSEYYPWNPEGPLCPLLAVPEVWAKVYPKSNIRRSVKNVLKRRRGAFPPDGPISIFIDSDERFGKALVWYLTTSRGRRALQSHWEREHERTESWVPSFEIDLYRSVSREFALPSNVLKEGRLHGILSPEGLVELLQAEGLPPEPDARTFALLAASAAMRQPKDAKAILGCLADHDARFVAWFGLKRATVEIEADDAGGEGKPEPRVQRAPAARVLAPGEEAAPQSAARAVVARPPVVIQSDVVAEGPVTVPQLPDSLAGLTQPHLLSENELGEIFARIKRGRADLLRKRDDTEVANQEFNAAVRRIARQLGHSEGVGHALVESIPSDASGDLIESLHRDLPAAKERTEAVSRAASEIARLEGQIRVMGGAVPPPLPPAEPAKSAEQFLTEALARTRRLAQVHEGHILQANRIENLRREFKSLEEEGGRRGKLYRLEAEEWELIACDALRDPELLPLVWAASRMWLSMSAPQGDTLLHGEIMAEVCKGEFPHADTCGLVGWLPRQGFMRWLDGGGGRAGSCSLRF